MTTAQILMLATEALTYDAVVVLWVTSRGTQPVLMPRSLGRRSSQQRDRYQAKARGSTVWPSGERVRSGT